MPDALTLLIVAIIAVESGGDWGTAGRNGEIGGMQITAACVADVNRILGEDKFTHEDAANPHKAAQIFVIYTDHYLRRKPAGMSSIEARARIWNGGPDGASKPETAAYAHRVVNLVRKMEER